MRKFTKIFGIGLSRTGTHSLTVALRHLGLTAVHFPATFAEVEAHDAATDTQVADQFQLLDRAFPASLFVLTIRDVESWLESCERFWASLQQFARAPQLRSLHERLYGAADFDRAIYANAYQRHMALVACYFAARPADLLHLNICRGDGWSALAAFLKVDPPAIPFPHIQAPGRKIADDGSLFQHRSAQHHSAQNRSAMSRRANMAESDADKL